MILITTSCGSRDEAERIAVALVEAALAACVQILPATSIYRWKGAIERAEEHVLHIKTRAAHADRRSINDPVPCLRSPRTGDMVDRMTSAAVAVRGRWYRTAGAARLAPRRFHGRPAVSTLSSQTPPAVPHAYGAP